MWSESYHILSGIKSLHYCKGLNLDDTLGEGIKTQLTSCGAKGEGGPHPGPVPNNSVCVVQRN